MDTVNAPSEEDKKTWTDPSIEVLDVGETEGLGGGGPDFGSELS
ncbi:MAG: paeninodin family lasso peptide [Alphaproteobacteria bacterium]|nr:MAG: paeninodin family lasso peptide [Alphaproteobacteria bacterium]